MHVRVRFPSSSLLLLLTVALLALGGAAAGCSSAVPVCDAKTPSAVFVIQTMDIARENPAGVSEGFDLDSVVSDGKSSSGCMQPDFTSPAGVRGIDNQLTVVNASLGTFVPMTDIGASMQASIDSGKSLTLIEFEGVDDFINDDCLNLTLYAGRVPAGSTLALDPATGHLAAGQTFDVAASSFDANGNPVIHVPSASIVNGELNGGPFDIAFSGTNGTTTLRGARIRGQVSASGIVKGVIGGEVSIDEMLAQAAAGGASQLQLSLYQAWLEGLTDLSPDSKMGGVCRGLSVALVFQAVIATKGSVVP